MKQLENENLIKKWESLELKAYLPTPNDVWTIGWGHTKGVKRGMTITRHQAQRFFEEDVQWAEDAVNKLVKVPLNQNQFDALVSFVFNIGETNFRNSTLLRKLNRKDYEGAANEFPRWKHQKGKVLRGLVRRRAEEMEIFLDPVENNNTTGPVDTGPNKEKAVKSPDIWTAITGVLGAAGASAGGTYLGDLSWPVIGASIALVAVAGYLVWTFIKKRREDEA